jgi:hypothetical protein
VLKLPVAVSSMHPTVPSAGTLVIANCAEATSSPEPDGPSELVEQATVESASAPAYESR